MSCVASAAGHDALRLRAGPRGRDARGCGRIQELDDLPPGRGARGLRLPFAAPEDAIAFEGLLRHCLADAALVAAFDRLTASSPRLAGTPVNIAVDLRSGRTAAELRRFAGFVKDVVWDRLPPPQRADAGSPGVTFRKGVSHAD